MPSFLADSKTCCCGQAGGGLSEAFGTDMRSDQGGVCVCVSVSGGKGSTTVL